MCVSIPGRVLAVPGDGSEPRMATTDVGGVPRQVCLAYTPEVGVGDYVLVHAGFAVERISERKAREAWLILRTAAELGGVRPVADADER